MTIERSTDPAEDRTHFGDHGSAEPAANRTAPNPAASAVRSSVPALPGSAMPTRTSTATPAGTSSTVCSGRRAMAAMPWDVTASVALASTPGTTVWTATRRRQAGRRIGAGLDEDDVELDAGGDGVGHEDRSLDDDGGLVVAGAAIGRQAPQPLEVGGSRAATRRTRPLGPGCVWTWRPEPSLAQAAASLAAEACFTRAAKAAASVTARSARTLRSTSMPAAFRPAMKRL